jgi:tetratricopeptide (TPR) repeat protein
LVLLSARGALSVALTVSLLGICTPNTERALAQSNPTSKSIESEVAAHFTTGQEATRAGQEQRAIQEYREVLHLMPGLTEARVNLGLAYYATGQYPQASIELEKARQQRPHLVAANLFLGIVYQKLGFPRNAIPLLQDVLRQDSANQEALRTLAACYLDVDDYRDALKVYLRLFASDTDPIEARYALGQNYLAVAKQLSNEISRKFQGTAWEARLAGDVFAEQQRWVDAAAQYRRALALEANIPGLHAALGDALLRQGKLEDAELEYRVELRRDPDSEEALIGLAATDLERGTTALALENVTRIWDVFPPFLRRQTGFPTVKIEAPKLATLTRDLTSAPDSPAREFLLASIYRAAGLNEQARQQWSKLLPSLNAWNAKKVGHLAQENGGACAAHRYAECAQLIQAQNFRSPVQEILLGRALVALGDDQKAAGAFAEALNRDHANAPSRYWLIRSCQRLALANFNQMMEQAPDSWRVHQIEGEYYQQRLDYEKAIEEFQTALKAHPDSAELHEQLGMAYLLNKNAAEGKAEIEQALQLDPTRTHSLYLLGRMFFRNRDIPRSIEYFQGALRYDPRFLPARAALGRPYLRVGKPARAVPQLEEAAPTDRDGDLHYQLSMAYRQLGKNDLAAHALAVSQQLRKKSATYQEAGVAAAEQELANE